MSAVLSRLSLRRLGSIAGLTFAWCALWGSASVANIASGVLVGSLASSRLIGTPAVGSVRPKPLMRFAFVVAKDLVASTVSVSYEVITPVDFTDEAIVKVPLPTTARPHLLLLVVAVTLTPGTAVVDVDPDTGCMYLHLLHAERAGATIEHVKELAELACRSFPVPDDHEVGT